MSDSEKNKCKGKDVTKQVKSLLKKHGSKSNINFKTKPSKKKIRTRRKKVKGGWVGASSQSKRGGNKQGGGGWNMPKITGQKGGGQKGGEWPFARDQ